MPAATAGDRTAASADASARDVHSGAQTLEPTTAGLQGAEDETCRGNAHVVEPKATAQSGDLQTICGDALLSDAEPGSVASFITDLVENEAKNYNQLLSECTPSTHHRMTVEEI